VTRETPGAEKARDTSDRDSIVIQLPKIDPGLIDFFREMVPGRALLRVLTNMPDEVLVHTRAARRERLLALRALIDGLIEETEKPVSHQRAREVEIE
jgi:hypothetical protein